MNSHIGVETNGLSALLLLKTKVKLWFFFVFTYNKAVNLRYRCSQKNVQNESNRQLTIFFKQQLVPKENDG